VKCALAIAAALVVGACKQAAEPTPASEVLAKSRALAAQICACKDRGCAAPLLLEWNQMSKLLHGATFTEEQVEGLTTEDTRVERCMAALPK
jgi:hypothetical protein